VSRNLASAVDSTGGAKATKAPERRTTAASLNANGLG